MAGKNNLGGEVCSGWKGHLRGSIQIDLYRFHLQILLFNHCDVVFVSDNLNKKLCL